MRIHFTFIPPNEKPGEIDVGMLLSWDAILEWCQSNIVRLSDEQKLVWNKFMEKRGWRDEDDGSTQELEAYKAASGLAHRTDLVTFFDYYEVDEGRRG